MIRALCAVFSSAIFLTGCENREVQDSSTISNDTQNANLRTAATTKIQLLIHPTLGVYMADKDRRTLYFDAGDVSPVAIYEEVEHPAFFEKLVAADLPASLKLSDFGTTKTRSGKNITTYKGWPLHYAPLGNSAGADTYPGPGVPELPGNVSYNRSYLKTVQVAKPDYNLLFGYQVPVGEDGRQYGRGPGDIETLTLTDAFGRTLYRHNLDSFEKNNFTATDTKNLFPIYELQGPITQTMERGGFVNLKGLSTINVNGKKQVCLHGWPLYYYSGDKGVRGSTKAFGVNPRGKWSSHELRTPPPTR
ncbi:hypothetical protein DYBT9275_03100 [Dyadobacter sp. CECT 9275]|uniref:Lipoprotein n=2 Tax=Dyadobacter helix TaxID=2822344 RepID=A0A916NCA4_9BACT|nr:hypothetical protein DYBT9275_03100 [Dyadobacter sp. CECT 9275]